MEQIDNKLDVGAIDRLDNKLDSATDAMDVAEFVWNYYTDDYTEEHYVDEMEDVIEYLTTSEFRDEDADKFAADVATCVEQKIVAYKREVFDLVSKFGGTPTGTKITPTLIAGEDGRTWFWSKYDERWLAEDAIAADWYAFAHNSIHDKQFGEPELAELDCAAFGDKMVAVMYELRVAADEDTYWSYCATPNGTEDRMFYRAFGYWSLDDYGCMSEEFGPDCRCVVFYHALFDGNDVETAEQIADDFYKKHKTAPMVIHTPDGDVFVENGAL